MASNSKPSGGVAVALLAAVALSAPVSARFEGTVPHAYLDPAGIPTECTGETKDVRWGVRFTPAQCQQMLVRRQMNDFAPAVLRCVPGFIDPRRRRPFAMAIDASYNAGPGAFCRSEAARAFNAGRWPQGCEALRHWRITARVNGRETVLPGLVTRRAFEADTCLTGAG